MYLEHGQPVTILTQWRTGDGPGGPRNVRIRRPDGTETIRPFRGLRRTTSMSDEDLVQHLAGVIERVEANWDRETSGPGSRFEAETRGHAQARGVINHLVGMGLLPGVAIQTGRAAT